MRRRFVIGVVIILAIAGASIFWVWHAHREVTVLQEGSVVKGGQYEAVSSMIKTESIPSDWKTYKNDHIKVALRYPKEMFTQEYESQGIFYVGFGLWGPTQKDGTELFDGIGLNIWREAYSTNQTFETFIEQKRKDQVGSSNTPVSPAVPVQIAGHDGSVFDVEGLGGGVNMYIPLGHGEVIGIDYKASDPKSIGFQHIVDQMLGSLVIE